MANFIIMIIDRIQEKISKIMEDIENFMIRVICGPEPEKCFLETLQENKSLELSAAHETLKENEGLGKSVEELKKIKREKLRIMSTKENYF